MVSCHKTDVKWDARKFISPVYFPPGSMSRSLYILTSLLTIVKHDLLDLFSSPEILWLNFWFSFCCCFSLYIAASYFLSSVISNGNVGSYLSRNGLPSCCQLSWMCYCVYLLHIYMQCLAVLLSKLQGHQLNLIWLDEYQVLCDTLLVCTH